MLSSDDYTCDPELHLYYNDRALARAFNKAKQSGNRYLGVVVQHLPLDDVYSSRQLLLAGRDAEELVRQLRELTLRPNAPYAFLARIFDTASTYEQECNAAIGKTVEQLFPPQDLPAYQRYKVQYNAHLSRPTRRGFFAQVFGKGR